MNCNVGIWLKEATKSLRAILTVMGSKSTSVGYKQGIFLMRIGFAYFTMIFWNAKLKFLQS